MTNKKVTANNTKTEILDAYNEVVAQLKNAQSEKLDPAKEVATKKATETLTQAETTANQSIEDQIAGLQKHIASILGGLSNSFTEEINTYNNLKDAIALKEAELKELFDIEREAFSLAALVNTKKELSAKYDEDMEQRRLAAVAQLEEIRKEIQETRAKFEQDMTDRKRELEVARKREAEEYRYNFDRTKQRELDELQDELDAERKSFQEALDEQQMELDSRFKNVQEREDKVTVREQKMSDLEAQVLAFPTREAQIRAEVEESTRKDAARTAAITENSIKKHYESEKLVLENNIKLLEQALQQERAKNAELSTKLDGAYEKIQNMALASVQSSNESKTFEKFASMMTDKNQK